MAKKDPMDMPVEERLKVLYQLQTTLSGIDEKRALRGELPLEVQDLEDEIEGLMTRVEKIKNEIGEFQRAITLKNGEISDAKASVERYQAQLNEVSKRFSILDSRSFTFSFSLSSSARVSVIISSSSPFFTSRSP